MKQTPIQNIRDQSYVKIDLCSVEPIFGLGFQAVIGAGSAGLVSARELKREGHNVQVGRRLLLRYSALQFMLLTCSHHHCDSV